MANPPVSSKKSKDACCQNCFYSHRDPEGTYLDEDEVRCRRYPRGEKGQPTMFMDEWCGEWKVKYD